LDGIFSILELIAASVVSFILGILDFILFGAIAGSSDSTDSGAAATTIAESPTDRLVGSTYYMVRNYNGFTYIQI
jgi:hypothetical protein